MFSNFAYDSTTLTRPINCFIVNFLWHRIVKLNILRVIQNRFSSIECSVINCAQFRWIFPWLCWIMWHYGPKKNLKQKPNDFFPTTITLLSLQKRLADQKNCRFVLFCFIVLWFSLLLSFSLSFLFVRLFLQICTNWFTTNRNIIIVVHSCHTFFMQ